MSYKSVVLYPSGSSLVLSTFVVAGVASVPGVATGGSWFLGVATGGAVAAAVVTVGGWAAGVTGGGAVAAGAVVVGATGLATSDASSMGVSSACCSSPVRDGSDWDLSPSSNNISSPVSSSLCGESC